MTLIPPLGGKPFKNAHNIIISFIKGVRELFTEYINEKSVPSSDF